MALAVSMSAWESSLPDSPRSKTFHSSASRPESRPDTVERRLHQAQMRIDMLNARCISERKLQELIFSGSRDAHGKKLEYILDRYFVFLPRFCSPVVSQCAHTVPIAVSLFKEEALGDPEGLVFEIEVVRW